MKKNTCRTLNALIREREQRIYTLSSVGSLSLLRRLFAALAVRYICIFTFRIWIFSATALRWFFFAVICRLKGDRCGLVYVCVPLVNSLAMFIDCLIVLFAVRNIQVRWFFYRTSLAAYRMHVLEFNSAALKCNELHCLPHHLTKHFFSCSTCGRHHISPPFCCSAAFMCWYLAIITLFICVPVSAFLNVLASQSIFPLYGIFSRCLNVKCHSQLQFQTKEPICSIK